MLNQNCISGYCLYRGELVLRFVKSQNQFTLVQSDDAVKSSTLVNHNIYECTQYVITLFHRWQVCVWEGGACTINNILRVVWVVHLFCLISYQSWTSLQQSKQV